MTQSGPTILVIGADSPIRRAYTLLIEALGAGVVCRRPAEPLDDALDVVAVVALGDDLIAALDPGPLAAALSALRRRPLLVVGLGVNGEVLDAVAEVTGIRLSTAPPARAHHYSFAAGEPLLWPFAGLRLAE